MRSIPASSSSRVCAARCRPWIASPIDLVNGLNGTAAGYAASTSYDAFGDVTDEEIGSGTTNLTDINSSYDATTVTGARIIPLPSGGDVVRTGATTSYYFEVPDPHGTNDLSLDHTAQTPAWRQFTPYGAPRGTAATWIDNRGFLDKPNDPSTGLTYDGARAYDPATASFTSPDPILTPADPLDLNPYLYAYGNPVGNSDPTGVAHPGVPGGAGVMEAGPGGTGGRALALPPSPVLAVPAPCPPVPPRPPMWVSTGAGAGVPPPQGSPGMQVDRGSGVGSFVISSMCSGLLSYLLCQGTSAPARYQSLAHPAPLETRQRW